MQIEDRTYYEEEQKMEAKWIYIVVLFMTITSLAAIVAILYNAETEWYMIGIIGGAILLSDGFIFFLFKTMKLEIALTKKGFYYNMFMIGNKPNYIDWAEVDAILIRKSPSRGYGVQKKFKYGDVYTMNQKEGVELTLKNGKKKFFSLKDPEEFKKGFRKLELALQID